VRFQGLDEYDHLALATERQDLLVTERYNNMQDSSENCYAILTSVLAKRF
jgi:hypothetical protein